MKKPDSFDAALEFAVTEGLRGELGDSAGTISVFVDPGIAINKPDSYVRSLTKILGQDARIEDLVRAIGQRLYESFGLQFEEKNGWKLSDYVADAIDRIESGGDYRAASNAFKGLAEDYRTAAGRIPNLSPILSGLAVEMGSWASVNEARFQHQEEQFAAASESYSAASKRFESSGQESFLAKYFGACSLLETGEALSREEKQEESVESFKSAAVLFREVRGQSENRVAQNSEDKEVREFGKWVNNSLSQERYCQGRAELDEARVLDKRGDETGSSAKYRSASQRFQELSANAQNEQARRELEFLTLSCHAWAEMKEAEASAAPELYAEAADLFAKAESAAPKKKFRLLALASSSMCKALESGTKFRRTRDIQLYSKIKKDLETATDYYQSAGMISTADWTRATGKLFDALVYLTDGATEIVPKRKTELFQLAEKHLDAAARLYGQAGFLLKRDQALQLLKRAREDMELLMGPIDALSQTPALTSVVVPPISPSDEKREGLEEIEAAKIVGNVSLSQEELAVGGELTLRIEIANIGRGPAILVKLENAAPQGLELQSQKRGGRGDDSTLDMGGKRLEYLKTLELSLRLRTIQKGNFQLAPRIVFVDEKFGYKSYEFESKSVMVRELGISGWLKGPR